MRPIATYGVAWSARVCVSVCLLVKFVSPAKTAERIEMLIRCRLGGGPAERCIALGPDRPREGPIFGCCSAHENALWVTAAVYAAKKSITASARLLQPTALLQTVTLTSPSEKSATLRCGVSSKFYYYYSDLLTYLLTYWSWCACVSAAKSELSERCTADRQCRDINAVCLNAVCTCRPGYTGQQSTCSTSYQHQQHYHRYLIIILIISIFVFTIDCYHFHPRDAMLRLTRDLFALFVQQ